MYFVQEAERNTVVIVYTALASGGERATGELFTGFPFKWLQVYDKWNPAFGRDCVDVSKSTYIYLQNVL